MTCLACLRMGSTHPFALALEKRLRCVSSHFPLDHLSHPTLWQILQYSFKLLIPFLQWRARLQHQAGRRAAPTSGVAESLGKLAGLINEARTLFGFCGKWCSYTLHGNFVQHLGVNGRFGWLETRLVSGQNSSGRTSVMTWSPRHWFCILPAL